MFSIASSISHHTCFIQIYNVVVLYLSALKMWHNWPASPLRACHLSGQQFVCLLTQQLLWLRNLWSQPAQAAKSSKFLLSLTVAWISLAFTRIIFQDAVRCRTRMPWIHSHMSSSSSLLAFFLPPSHRLTLLSSSSETLKFNSYRRPLTLFGSTEKSLTAARVLFSKFDNWQLEFQVVTLGGKTTALQPTGI